MEPDFAALIERALGPSFRVSRELVGGAMSRVFVAQEIGLQREIVIKILAPELEATVNAARFRAEVQRSAMLQHPHIVPVLGTGVLALDDGRELPFYTMPFIEGESLRTRLERTGRLPLEEAIQILDDVAEALAHAHQRGVVHRDIKPANILISGSHAVVTDFGVSKALGAERRAGLTGTGMTLGTPGYMAPEQTAGDPGLDHRADLYSFGVVAYEVLAGRPPFGGSTLQEVLAAQFRDEVEPLRRLRADVPVLLQRVVTSCLQRDASQRIQTADELVAALRGLRTASHPGTRATPSRRTAGRVAAVVAGLAVVALAARRFLASREPEAAGPAAVLSPRVSPTIAVVPADVFGAAGADGSRQLLDHLAEDTNRDLARIEGLQVKAHLSVLALMHRAPFLTPREVGDSLGVAHVLTFLARPRDGRTVVTAQLIETTSQTAVWERDYQTADDSTDLSGIRKDVVAAMGNRLLGEAMALSVQTDYWRPDPAEASFREGRLALQRRTRAGLLEAVEKFEVTLRIDSTHTGAAANLGNALALLLSYGYRVPGGHYETAARALTMAERAVRLAPDEPRGYVVRGYLTNLLLGPVARVRADYQKAMSLQTTDADFASWTSLLLLRENYNGAAITEARLAVDRDPESPGRHVALALALLQTQRYAEADSVAGLALALQPDLRRARQIQAVAMLLAGQPDECIARQPWPYVGVEAACLEAAGQQAAAARLVDSLQRVVDRGRPQSAEYDDLIPIVELVAYHAWRGAAAEATKYLRLAFERSPIGIDPRVARSGILDQVLRDSGFATALQTLQDSAWPEVRRRAERARAGSAADGLADVS